MSSDWSRLTRFLIVTVAVTLLAAACLRLTRPTAAETPQGPRLLVLVVFDQMRGDFPERWRTLFGPGGFRRLEDDGAWFTECNYPYSYTVTAAGHASLLTGCSPDRHGIVGNDWYERDLHAPVYCVASERYVQVPPPAGDNARRPGSGAAGVSPDRLMAPTVGDVLKTATNGKGRVVAVSFKDRAAVLPGGLRPDACYWQDRAGRFVTSTYYRSQLHPWVASFNQARPADRWFGKRWERLRPDLDYAAYSGPDDVAGEGKGYDQGRTFPHPMTGGLTAPGAKYYDTVFNSPFGNELVLEFARRAIDTEGLGRGPAPDLLCISFSSNDAIGHTWGPDSQEVLDVTLRSDRIMRELLSHLDERVGRGGYLLAVTADHGVCPLPEVSRTQGRPAQRLGTAVLTTKAEEFLSEKFGKGSGSRWLANTGIAPGPWLFLNELTLREQKREPTEVAAALAAWLREQPAIAAAYTRAEIASEMPGDEMLNRVRHSYYPSRCGDVYAVEKPYSLFMDPLSTGTTHGTPHHYDTHVPLLVYGPGISGGVRKEPVTPQAIAAIFADAVGLPAPAKAEATLPHTLRAP